MSFSFTHIKGTNLDVTDALRSLAEEKFQKLEKFLKEDTDMTCNLELEKKTGSMSGSIFRAEVNVRHHGKLYRAEATTDQIEKSIDKARNDIEREIRKAHSKGRTMMKHGGAKLKKIMRFGKD